MEHARRIKHLYHLSDINHDGEVFVPRVPATIAQHENSSVKRVCFSTTMSGAFKAISQCYFDHIQKLYVHVPESMPKKILRPDEYDVYDVELTKEKWVVEKVKMKCIGCAMFRGYEHDDDEIPAKVNIQWIEKYNQYETQKSKSKRNR